MAHRLAGNNLAANGCLNGHVKLLTRDELLQLLTHTTPYGVGVVDIGECGEGIDRVAVEQNLQFDQFGGLEAIDVIIERGIALGDTLEFVVKVKYHLAEGKVEGYLDAVSGEISLVLEYSTLVHAEFDYGSNEVGFGNNLGVNVGFIHFGNVVRFGHAGGVVDILLLAIGEFYLVLHVGDSGDDIHVELPFKAFLHNFHVQQAEETATETETQSQRALGFKSERGIVEL